MYPNIVFKYIQKYHDKLLEINSSIILLHNLYVDYIHVSSISDNLLRIGRIIISGKLICLII